MLTTTKRAGRARPLAIALVLPALTIALPSSASASASASATDAGGDGLPTAQACGAGSTVKSAPIVGTRGPTAQ